jgi:hypothetical protein
MSFEVTLFEAILKELGEEMFVLGEGDHAVAHVAGREHLEVFAETAGGASVVGDGDDGGEVADDAGRVGMRWGGGFGSRTGCCFGVSSAAGVG